ncbi:hypothetical protein SCA6_018265 [Theobroma cacao]
MGNPQTRF